LKLSMLNAYALTHVMPRSKHHSRASKSCKPGCQIVTLPSERDIKPYNSPSFHVLLLHRAATL
jgi:hypothetical protein